MTQEEKAQRYDEAINAIKELKAKHPTALVIKDWIKENFPELAESEDEKIRKALIKFFTLSDDNADYQCYGVHCKDIVAWLEKQKTSDEALQYLKENHSPSEVSDFQAAMNIAVAKAYDKGYNNGLKKQGEQKPVDKVEPKFKVGDLVKYTNHNKQPIYKVNYIDKECYICTSDDATLGDEAVMHFAFDNPYLRLVEQKPADNVEPRFHEGEWINGYYTNYKVLSVNNDGYVVEDVDGNKINILFENEKFHHLWTIQDAKDGDVLCSNQMIVLFKQWEDNTDYSFVIAHAGIDRDGKLQITNGHWLISNKSKPATKEQRDTLFAKMREAGYEWDAEKKELKKIEDEPTDVVEPKFHEGDIIIHKELGGDYIHNPHKIIQVDISDKKYRLEGGLVAHFGEQDDYELVEAWSEDDMEKISWILAALQNSTMRNSSLKKENEDAENWLKSIKDRVQPQTQWKPNEEQMKALHDLNLTGGISYAGQGQTLIELYNNLKELTE